MSETSWHKSVDPKLKGTWNVHTALTTREVANKSDFFSITSSVSGSVGTATESNYCAANAFLDAFARYCKARGLKAISLGLGMISEVGWIYENPEIEALLLQKGIQPITQEELIQIVDLALSSDEYTTPELHHNALAAGHTLTGLEPHRLNELRDTGFGTSNMVLEDPRASILAHIFDNSERLPDYSARASCDYFEELANASKDVKSEISLSCTIQNMTAERFQNSTLIPSGDIEMDKQLAAYGMDSMLAAEFCTWIYRVSKVDVPFLRLLSNAVTLASLVEDIVKGLDPSF